MFKLSENKQLRINVPIKGFEGPRSPFSGDYTNIRAAMLTLPQMT